MNEKIFRKFSNAFQKIKNRNSVYPDDNDDISKVKSNILYFDRIYKIVTNKKIHRSDKEQSELLETYFKQYSNKIIQQISKDLNIRRTAFHINDIKIVNNFEICVSFEVIIFSKKNSSEIVENMKNKSFTANLIIKEFLKNNLGCKNAMICGRTTNISCIPIDFERLHLFCN